METVIVLRLLWLAGVGTLAAVTLGAAALAQRLLARAQRDRRDRPLSPVAATPR